MKNRYEHFQLDFFFEDNERCISKDQLHWLSFGESHRNYRILFKQFKKFHVFAVKKIVLYFFSK